MTTSFQTSCPKRAALALWEDVLAVLIVGLPSTRNVLASALRIFKTYDTKPNHRQQSGGAFASMLRPRYCDAATRRIVDVWQ